MPKKLILYLLLNINKPFFFLVNNSDNSSEFDENLNYDLFGIVKIDTSLPLQKKMNDFTNLDLSSDKWLIKVF